MITAITNDTTTAPSAQTYMKQTTGLDSNDFMTLFVTQLKNQDPTAPQDTSQMVAQMAQLTQVEQAYDANTNLKNILSALNGSSGMSAVSFIGKTVTAQGSQVNLAAGGQPQQLSFSLAAPATRLQVAIQNTSGNIVKTLTMGATAAGNGSVAWDGTGDDGKSLPAGIYSFSVTGMNPDGTSFGGTPLIKGAVTGVDLSQGTPVLSVGGVGVPLASVQSVS
jgi:flagellar basal-body rod modification protein FlgD